MITTFLFVICACILVLFRLYRILPRSSISIKRSADETCSVCVFLGSGGHTAEALTMVSALDFARYTPRLYVISEGDNLSAQKAEVLEERKASTTHELAREKGLYSIISVPRARQVHQSLLSTPPTALNSLLYCINLVSFKEILTRRAKDKPFADVLIMNGPGTCFILSAAVFLNKFFGRPSPKTIYVESFARVKSLSLSGKLLRPIVDRFIVQWPALLSDKGRGECRGWLV